jgi:hypothetical protein
MGAAETFLNVLKMQNVLITQGDHLHEALSFGNAQGEPLSAVAELLRMGPGGASAGRL